MAHGRKVWPRSLEENQESTIRNDLPPHLRQGWTECFSNRLPQSCQTADCEAAVTGMAGPHIPAPRCLVIRSGLWLSVQSIKGN